MATCGDFVLSLLPDGHKLTNEPRRQKCGAPDYILEKGDVPIGYIEAKDIERLDSLTPAEKDQFTRYTTSLDNLIYTDYLEFRFYKRGERVATTRIAEVQNGKIVPLLENLSTFTNLIQDFATYQTQTIKSAKQLASMMAKKARLMKEVFQKILEEDTSGDLHDQYETFKELLIHDISPADFADIYAETLAYGLFTARLHDTTLDTFSREEAYGLIPSSNPFLKKLFQYISTDLDDRAIWIVDDLCDIFRATDVHKMVAEFNRGTGRTDPFLHFYESFLGEYNPTKRKARGVWYTPESVVSFIVRGVDEILQTHFNLPKGLADTSKTTIMVDSQTSDRRTKTGVKQVEKEVHRVQVLDVATGTGTFLAEVISQIHGRYKHVQGKWNEIVDDDIIPRLHGFELLMASYAMCHMKLELLLRETGYQPKVNAPRLNVYLTNSLQQPEEETDRLRLVKWFSNESNEASRIKRDSPIMVAIGNPPYAISSSNHNPWINHLVDDYKKNLDEQNQNSLSDDYVKFIRLAEHYISKSGYGIAALITNNSFIDGVTHRKMRERLLKTYDEIYIYDLHGSTKKQETSPDGSPDQNVFDIQQGVSISFMIKLPGGNSSDLAKVFHCDLFGKRAQKYETLNQSEFSSTTFESIETVSPYYFFVPKNMDNLAEYQKFISVKSLFSNSGSGIKFRKDNLLIKPHFTPKSVVDMACNVSQLTKNDLLEKYKFSETTDWKLEDKRSLFLNVSEKDIFPVTYRPFDIRYTYYPLDKISDIIPRGDSRKPLMKHMLHTNIALLTCRQQSTFDFQHVFVTKSLADMCSVSLQTKETAYAFPLYTQASEPLIGEAVPNLDSTIWKKLQKVAPAATDPQAVFDYVYAVLHAPTYRSKYAEFLKSDFPRIPYPKDAEQFEQLAELGAHLRQLHLLEHTDCDAITTSYPAPGTDEVDKPMYDETEQRAYINETQYFGDVPKVAWEFPIGGYQPAQKWLKGRKGRALSLDDITHYQRIIATLTKTAELMAQVDEVYGQDM